MSQRLRPICIMGIISLLALFMLLPVAAAAPRATTQNVSVKDNTFDPKTITVNAGDTIA